jgi:hypothetical protein
MPRDFIVLMPPEAWKEYCLLQRRQQWLELRYSDDYRDCPGRLMLLKEIYSDVSSDGNVIWERPARS